MLKKIFALMLSLFVFTLNIEAKNIKKDFNYIINESTGKVTSGTNRKKMRVMYKMQFRKNLDESVEVKSLESYPFVYGLNDTIISDIETFMKLEVELGLLQKPIPHDKLFWEGK